jgi:signal transduction histidine kinase/CheY-like chemotaxis protein/HPt (histidine-containing phosphotransfer) domain-containing protein
LTRKVLRILAAPLAALAVTAVLLIGIQALIFNAQNELESVLQATGATADLQAEYRAKVAQIHRDLETCALLNVLVLALGGLGVLVSLLSSARRISRTEEQLENSAATLREFLASRDEPGRFWEDSAFTSKALAKDFRSALVALADREENLRLGRDRLEAAVEGAALGVWAWDLRKATGLVDLRACPHLIRGQMEVISDALVAASLIHPDDLQNLEDIWNDHLQGELPYFDSEFRVRGKDGNWHWVLSRGKVVERDEEGRPFRAAGCLYDISESKETMAELERQRYLAEDAARAKSNFLAAMSHEIRTPMNGVVGLTRQLLTTHLSPEQRRYAQLIRSSGEALMSILNDILDFSKIEAGKLELAPVDFLLTEPIEDCAALMRSNAESKGLALFVEADEKARLPVHGDSGRLRQVILNLLSNAVKFTEQGSVTLRIRIREVHVDGVSFTVEVEDTGIGIPDEVRDRLFESFSQVNATITRRYGGTGLGLAISRRLVDMMHGTIEVEAGRLCGSRFAISLRLPRAKGKVAANVSEPFDFAQSNLRGIAVLVAEDNPVNQVLARALLEKAGSRVELVEDGDAAARLAQAKRFDLILMDCQMPVMDGYQSTRMIRQAEKLTGRRVPIVGLSANAFPENREQCLAAGMDGFVAKPFDPDKLLSLCDALVLKRLGDAERAGSATPTAEVPVGISRLLERLGPEVLRDLSLAYLSSAPPVFAELMTAVQAKDGEAVRRLAHWLRGGLCRLAAPALFEALMEVDEHCAKPPIDFDAINRERLQSEFEGAIDSARAWAQKPIAKVVGA